MTSHFGNLLRVLRRESGATLGDVAAHLGCSISYVSDVEHGRRNPFGFDQIRKLTEILSCSGEDLLRAAAKDTSCVRFEDDREEVLEVAATLAAFLKSHDLAAIRRLRDFILDAGGRADPAVTGPGARDLAQSRTGCRRRSF